MNYFQSDLEYSLNERENEIFDKFYYRIFKNLKEIKIVNDINMQKDGIDKILIFENGKELLIDEKKRRKDYGDILLEEWSDFEKKKVGWLGDSNKETDYIVYAIMPSKKVFLFPFKLLQMAWINNYKKWRLIYKRRFAQNIGYRTSNLEIPTNIVMDAIKQEMTHCLEVYNKPIQNIRIKEQEELDNLFSDFNIKE